MEYTYLISFGELVLVLVLVCWPSASSSCAAPATSLFAFVAIRRCLVAGVEVLWLVEDALFRFAAREVMPWMDQSIDGMED